MKSNQEWTHKKLVRRMAQWLKHTQRMTVVISELSTRSSETPDVIGWQSGGHSVLIECKTSRADFFADAKKHFRQYTEWGMGNRRYMAAPKGLLKADEMPEGWGLLEVDNYVYTTKDAELMEANKQHECTMLISALRRLGIATAVYVVHDDEGDGSPSTQ